MPPILPTEPPPPPPSARWIRAIAVTLTVAVILLVARAIGRR